MSLGVKGYVFSLIEVASFTVSLSANIDLEEYGHAVWLVSATANKGAEVSFWILALSQAVYLKKD